MTSPVVAGPASSREVTASIGLGSVGLIVAKLAQMGAGFVFWIITARVLTVTDVGIVSAAVAGVLLCTQLGTLGAGSAVISCVGRGDDPRTVLEGATVVLVGATLVSALLYLAVSASQDGEVGQALASPVFVGVFMVAAVTGGGQIVLDQAGVALRRSRSGVTRYAVGGLVAVAGTALVPLFAPGSATAVFAAWTAGVLTVATIGFVQATGWVGARLRPRLRWSTSRRLLGVGMPNQVLTLTERLPALLVPVLVAHAVSAEAAALWYPAWMMAWMAYSAPVLVGIAQFAEGVRTPDGHRAAAVRGGLRWSLLIGGAVALVLVLGAEVLLGLLGREYAEASTEALRVLALGVLPFSVLQAYNAMCRSRHQFVEPIVVGAILCVAICTATVGAATHGTTAMALGWAGCSTVAAVWAALRLVSGSRR